MWVTLAGLGAGKSWGGAGRPGTYLPVGQVLFLEKVPNISSLIRKVIGQAGIFDIGAGKF